MSSLLTRRECLFGAALPLMAPRPNILWILAEDISPNLVCYGEPLVQTPNLDRLASQGVRFDRAYTTAPVCSASRSAIITGEYQTTIGAQNHRTLDKKPLPDGARLVTDRLREAGYFTVLSAAGPNKKDNKQAGSRGSGKTDFNFLVKQPFDGWDWSQRPAGKPFFAQLSIQESHKGYGWPLARKLTPRIDAGKLKLPPYWPDHPVARDEYANYLEAIQLMDRYVGEVMARLEAEGLAENTLVFFLGDNGSCTFRGKQFLYEGGIHVPLIARWPGKLGAGTVRKDLVSSLDVTAATLAAAGIPIPARLPGRDILNPAAPARTHLFAARDRCDIAIDRMRCVLDARYKYIRNYLPGMPYMQANPYKEREYPTWNLVKDLARQGKLTPEQALFAAPSKPVEELYDLERDPHEVRNLAADPAQKERLAAMRKLLDDWVRESGDRGATLEDPLPIYQDYFKKESEG
ncbi:MAG: sulfatase [Bryobacter sp.]|nr:sulfatase [Bryobacter sp.]